MASCGGCVGEVVPVALRKKVALRRSEGSLEVRRRVPWVKTLVEVLVLVAFLGGLTTFVRFLTSEDVQFGLWPFYVALLFSLVMLLIALNGIIDAAARVYVLAPDRLRVSGRGLLGATRCVIGADDLRYAYGECRQRSDDRADYAVCVGASWSVGPLKFAEGDDEVRAWMASLIRSYYGLPEFPPSERPPKGLEEFECRGCRYALAGTLMAGRAECPECGAEVPGWQREEWSTRTEALGGER